MCLVFFLLFLSYYLYLALTHSCVSLWVVEVLEVKLEVFLWVVEVYLTDLTVGREGQRRGRANY